MADKIRKYTFQLGVRETFQQEGVCLSTGSLGLTPAGDMVPGALTREIPEHGQD